MKARYVILTLAVAFIGLDALVVGGYWLLKHRAASAASQSENSEGTLLVAKEGKRYVGDQLQFFSVDQDGVIDATNNAWFNLYYTEGKSFRLSGQVWLQESSRAKRVPDLPDGFALFIREWDSLHRYSLTTRSIDLKRRLHGGVQDNSIVQIVAFQPPVFGAWIPFSVEVSAGEISFHIGDQSGVIPGPLDVDGANKIALTPGTRLKDVRLAILEPTK